MQIENNIWPKHISVDKRIVKILSESTYDNFPNSLKEILTNSYDADASEVKIKIDLKNELIEIEDNGKGMSEREFEFFTRIAGVKREKEGGATKAGRLIIGKFGVGFLSIFPFFKNYSIETKKSGSSEVLYASVPCYLYFAAGKLMDVSDIPIQGEVRIDSKKTAHSYTKISLSGFTPIAKAFFTIDSNSKHRKYSIQSLESLEKLKWRLAEELPIQYEDSRFNVLTSIYSPNLKFNVYVNDKPLLRKTFAKTLIDVNESELQFNRIYVKPEPKVNAGDVIKIGKIKFQYFILTDKTAVHPYEGRGLKIRNLNAGVGYRESFGLGSEVKGGRSRLQWLTGEILIIDGLNDLISVSRDKFYYDPDYELFQEYFVKRLSHHSNQLESEAEYQREESEPKIKNLNYIEEEEEAVSTQQVSFFQNKANKVKKATEKISKTLRVRNKSYKVQTSQWDYKKDFFPAVKIKGDKIVINKRYPLFNGKKYNDIFIKMHLMLISNLSDNGINKIQYTKLVNDILSFYNDYL